MCFQSNIRKFETRLLSAIFSKGLKKNQFSLVSTLNTKKEHELVGLFRASPENHT